MRNRCKAGSLGCPDSSSALFTAMWLASILASLLTAPPADATSGRARDFEYIESADILVSEICLKSHRKLYEAAEKARQTQDQRLERAALRDQLRAERRALKQEGEWNASERRAQSEQRSKLLRDQRDEDRSLRERLRASLLDGARCEALPEPRNIRLVPLSNDLAELIVDLDLKPGMYDRVRLIPDSGVVVLTETAALDPQAGESRTFRTDLGNLEFLGGMETRILTNVEAPVHAVTKLSEELVLDLDLRENFNLVGSPAPGGSGVKRVVFSKRAPAQNASTLGRISLRLGQATDSGGCVSDPLSGAVVTAVDDLGVVRGTDTTDQAGESSLRLPPGTYSVSVETAQESMTFEDQRVHLANVTDLGDVTFSRQPVAGLAFDRDRALLLAFMANTAYAKPGDGGWTAPIEDLVENDALPSPTTDYALALETQWPGSGEGTYDCWKFQKFIGNEATGTQSFVARNELNGDVVVSFRGTTPGETDLLEDLYTDAKIVKSRWDFRPGREPEFVLLGAHKGMRDAYFSIRDALESELDRLVAPESRVYFTGHSLGSGLAELAALDLADHLVGRGTLRDNIVMYGFGSPRVITYNLLPYYQEIVPNSFAVVAKDDYAGHAFDLVGEALPSFTDYTHIDLAVLSTSIVQIGNAVRDDRFAEIGKTRVVLGDDHRICLGGFDSNLVCAFNPLPLALRLAGVRFKRNYQSCEFVQVVQKLGHDQLQYLKRLETIDDGPRRGIPSVDVTLVQIGVGPLSVDRLVLMWDGEVQGPCDWVGLFRTDRDEPLLDASNPVGFLDFGPVGSAWTYANAGTNFPDGQSGFTTNLNPNLLLNRLDDFWVAYVDGFGNILAKKKYVR